MNIFDYKNSGTKLHKFRENYLLSPVDTSIFESNIDFINLFDDKSHKELVSRIIKFTNGIASGASGEALLSVNGVINIAHEIACALLINSHGARNLDYYNSYAKMNYSFIRALQFIFSRERIEAKSFNVIADELEANFISRNSIGYRYMSDLRNSPYHIQVEDYVEQMKNAAPVKVRKAEKV